MQAVTRIIERNLKDIWDVFTLECRRVFTEPGVIIIFFVAGLLYPVLYNMVYNKESVDNLPVAVVDDSRSADSRRFIHKMNATPEMEVRYHCNNMHEAKRLMQRHRVRGIVYFPRDYSRRLASLRTAQVSVYCDMSTFLYYKSVLMGCNSVMLDEMKQIQLLRYGMAGMAGKTGETLAQPIRYEVTNLFGKGGYPSFLLPVLLIMVIHQTLVFGIGMLGGGAREDRVEVELMPAHLRNRSVYRVVAGRALAYFLIYVPLVAIDLLLIPRLFCLPHEGRLRDIVMLMLPFMLATIFLGMTYSVLIKERETGLLTTAFFSLILVFACGVVFPLDSMPGVWRWMAMAFPSTHGVQGYIKVNSMGATLMQARPQFMALWAQAGFYFITACLGLAYINRNRPAGARARERRGAFDHKVRTSMVQRRERKAQRTEGTPAAPAGTAPGAEAGSAGEEAMEGYGND